MPSKALPNSVLVYFFLHYLPLKKVSWLLFQVPGWQHIGKKGCRWLDIKLSECICMIFPDFTRKAFITLKLVKDCTSWRILRFTRAGIMPLSFIFLSLVPDNNWVLNKYWLNEYWMNEYFWTWPCILTFQMQRDIWKYLRTVLFCALVITCNQVQQWESKGSNGTFFAASFLHIYKGQFCMRNQLEDYINKGSYAFNKVFFLRAKQWKLVMYSCAS